MSSPVDHETRIPITRVVLNNDVEELVLQVLRSGRLVQGPVVEELEVEFARLTQTVHAVALNSGTSALVAALRALRLDPHAEIITSPFTFVATLNAILEAGATATFADVGDDFTLSIDALAASITDRTAVVLPVHLYGYAVDMPSLTRVLEGTEIRVVEDASQAQGSAVSDRPVGSWGIGCFSLYATKLVAAGEGGMVTTNDDDVADRVRLIRNQGMRTRYDYDLPGSNFRMTDLHAAVAVPQMRSLQRTISARAENARRLTAGLDGLPGVVLPQPGESGRHVWHQYTIRVTPEAPIDRSTLAEYLRIAGVETSVYYPRPVYDYECFRSHPRVRLSATPNADRASREVLSLPVHQHLHETDVDRIVSAVREAMHA